MKGTPPRFKALEELERDGIPVEEGVMADMDVVRTFPHEWEHGRRT